MDQDPSPREGFRSLAPRIREEKEHEKSNSPLFVKGLAAYPPYGRVRQLDKGAPPPYDPPVARYARKSGLTILLSWPSANIRKVFNPISFLLQLEPTNLYE